MYLLDTDVLSNLMRRQPSTGLIAKLAVVPFVRQYVSSIALGELVYGALRRGLLPEDFISRIEAKVLANLAVLRFDATAARHYGEVRAALERRGTPLGEADLRIASIALAQDLTLVTGNIRHFERVPGLSIENCL